MSDMLKILLMMLSLVWVRLSDAATCSPTATLCQFKLFIEPRLTMMNEKMRVVPCNGRLCNYNDEEKKMPLDKSEEDTVITTDGVYSRLVISVNNTVPGPELIVYEDQMVEVLVTNNLHTDSVTIHFHGAHQKDTPYMDGVAFVTQCPIHPGNTFNYTFKATPHGTHWYHAHIGDQRSMGLYGPYIVRKRDEPEDYIDEHIITLQDWNHDMDPETAYQKMLNGIYNCNFEGKCNKYETTWSVDGANFSAFQFHSGLINGKGRYYIDGNKATHNSAPLTTYTVEKNKLYRFRVISAATLYPFRLYVAEHKMTIIASDGREMKPLEVESFIIHTGERMDFILNTSKADGQYMIVAETLEVLPDDKRHAAEAIVQYKNSTNSPVSETPLPCSDFPDGLCPVFNCPFLYYPEGISRKCLTFHDASATEAEAGPDYESIITGEATKTFFLNFAFPGPEGNTPGSVNGRQFVSPTVNAYSQPSELASVNCDGKDCGKGKICECMYAIEIEEDQIIDIVLLNMGVGRGWSHPVHIHGHSFFVVAMGFPDYNTQTGRKIKQNSAIDCKPETYCTDVNWTGRKGRKKRDADDRIPPLKDTIVVPTDGYVITRFKADNPGLWFIHCHIDLHNTNGMAMVMNESFDEHKKKPSSLPRCRDYLNPGDYSSKERTSVCCGNDLRLSWFLLAILVLFSVSSVDFHP